VFFVVVVDEMNLNPTGTVGRAKRERAPLHSRRVGRNPSSFSAFCFFLPLHSIDHSIAIIVLRFATYILQSTSRAALFSVLSGTGDLPNRLVSFFGRKKVSAPRTMEGNDDDLDDVVSATGGGAAAAAVTTAEDECSRRAGDEATTSTTTMEAIATSLRESDDDEEEGVATAKDTDDAAADDEDDDAATVPISNVNHELRRREVRQRLSFAKEWKRCLPFCTSARPPHFPSIKTSVVFLAFPTLYITFCWNRV